MSDALGVGNEPLRNGAECMLYVVGRHFRVRVLALTAETMQVTFPGRHYPIAGLTATLEFHDPNGFTYYTAEVLEGPTNVNRCLLLRRPAGPMRSIHRDHLRVPTDLLATVREQVHLRRYNAAVLDIGMGGALLQTAAVFECDATLEMLFSFPGEAECTVLGQVVHLVERPAADGGLSFLYGVRFIDVERGAEEAIGRYTVRRILDLYAD